MPPGSMPSDYKVDGAPAKTASAPGQPRPEGYPKVEEFLQLLSRAVRQFHTYPPTSPLCIDAVGASHRAFTALDRPDRLVIRVTPRELVVDEIPLGRGTIIEQELVRPLHRGNVAALDIDGSASLRDFTRLCTGVSRCSDLVRNKTTFAELLVEHGVGTIAARMAQRPEVLDVGARPAPLWDLVEHNRNRARPTVTGGPVSYLYPPEKGWVRLEPGAHIDTISLVDLATLVGEPADIATMLLRLTDDDASGAVAADHALEQKFTDVATLFAALDAHLAQVMFDKLARAVLAIEPDRRSNLLRRTILPGLLDGRADGAVLRAFPDPDLADSLCLLLELETAAPEVVAAALNRLELPADRREAVLSLVDQKMQEGERADAGGRPARDQNVDRFARRLVHVESAPGKNFEEFAAFDLSIDDQTVDAIARVRETAADTDLVMTQLDCLWRLVRLEPNPTPVEAFLRRALTLCSDLDRAGRWRDLGAVAVRFRDLANALKESRPDVADAIGKALGGFCNESRTRRLLDLHGGDADSRAVAALVVQGFGEALAPGFVTLLDDPSLQAKMHALTALMCEHAPLVAPGLVPRLGRCGLVATRAIVRVCGFAGTGYEPIVAEQLTSHDEATVREALRALARIGTQRAAALVGFQIQNGSAFARVAAEETLWHLPHAQTALQLRDILGHREFVARNPQVVARLIDRAAQTGATGLKDVLEGLEALRFRFWNPGLVRVALKARELRDK